MPYPPNPGTHGPRMGIWACSPPGLWYRYLRLNEHTWCRYAWFLPFEAICWKLRSGVKALSQRYNRPAIVLVMAIKRSSISYTKNREHPALIPSSINVTSTDPPCSRHRERFPLQVDVWKLSVILYITYLTYLPDFTCCMVRCIQP